MIKLPNNPYAGGLSEFKRKFPGVPEWKWWHGQMRGWAMYWRSRKSLAAILDKPVAELHETYIFLAKNYRDTVLKLRSAARGDAATEANEGNGGMI